MKQLIEPQYERHDGPVHGWFSFSYSNYMVLHRSILQEMPLEWQERFIACIDEIDDYFDTTKMTGKFTVLARNDRGRFVSDPLSAYKYPNQEIIDGMKWIPDKEASE